MEIFNHEIRKSIRSNHRERHRRHMNWIRRLLFKKKTKQINTFVRGTSFSGALGPIGEDPHDILKKQVGSRFLKENGPMIIERLDKLNIDMKDLRQFEDDFVKSMQNGLLQKKSDLKMLPTYVTRLPNGKEVGNFLALDLGGTNFRVLLLRMNGNPSEKVLESRGYAIPLTIMKSNGGALFGFIADKIKSFHEEHDLDNSVRMQIGFTFSFPCQQESLQQGYLIGWTKGFDCPDVVGEDVVEFLQNSIDEREINLEVIALVNDTVGTLIATSYMYPDCAMGMIVGTGTNACYLEKIVNIKKVESTIGPPDKYMIINCEWGAYGDSDKNYNLERFTTVYDREVDEASINPGFQKFEKMISGMYLGEIVRIILVDLVENNLLFPKNGLENRP
ncbi:hypothetical protein ACOME3_001647 [Neoechinorhynchus agilis]